MLIRLASAYSASLAVAPLQTKALTAAVVAVSGDALAQHAENTEWDAMRTASFATFAASYSGAAQHFLFAALRNLCDGSVLMGCRALQTIESHWLAAAEMTFINQFVIVPIVYLPLFYLWRGAWRGHGLRSIISEARHKFVGTLHVNWAFWLPFQLATFALVASELVVPITCAAGVFWNFLLSTLTSLASRPAVIAQDVAEQSASAEAGAEQQPALCAS